jgi:hypothetical protein
LKLNRRKFIAASGALSRFRFVAEASAQYSHATVSDRELEQAAVRSVSTDLFPSPIIINSGVNSPHALAVADFDGGGNLDGAIASFTDAVVPWHENNGDGTFIPRDIDTGHRQQAYDLKTADLDADDRVDLILAGRESRNTVWYPNRK